MHFNAEPVSIQENTTGCLIAQDHLGNHGYPMIQRDGKRTLLSRHIWEECFGFIPDEMCVCRHCDNPACVNPEHLFLGTQADNVADMWSKGRARTPFGMHHGSELSWAKLTEADVAHIRHIYQKGHPIYGCRPLARQYKVHQKTMMQVLNGERWKHVPMEGMTWVT